MTDKMQVSNNKKLFRFEIVLENGEFATLTYRWLKGSMVLMHTLVPKTAQTQGIGSKLVKGVLEYVQSHQLKIIVYCPFVQLYMSKYHEFDSLLDSAHIK